MRYVLVLGDSLWHFKHVPVSQVPLSGVRYANQPTGPVESCTWYTCKHAGMYVRTSKHSSVVMYYQIRAYAH